MALYTTLLTQILITVISVVGVFVFTGMTGMFSLGQAAFMAIGAYACGILVKMAGFPFPLAIATAVIIAILVGFLVGLPTVRLRRDYIALVTLGFGEAITALLNRMTPLTGGASGLIVPKKTTLPLVLISAAVAVALAALFKKSKYGRQCIAIRSDELAAKAMGINVPKVKMIAFLFSVAVTAYSGALHVFFTSYADPTQYGWKKSADWVIMVFFGSTGSITGSVLAAFLLSGLPELLRFLLQYRGIFYAILVLLIINFKPSGLLGDWELTPSNVVDLFRRIKKFFLRLADKRKAKAANGEGGEE